MTDERLYTRAWKEFQKVGTREFAYKTLLYFKNQVIPTSLRYHYTILKYSMISYRFDTSAHPVMPIYVNPSTIEYCTGSSKTVAQNPHLDNNHPDEIFNKDDFGRVVGGDWDYDGCRVSELELYKGLKQHFLTGIPWEETQFYHQHADRIKETGSSLGCCTIGELMERCKHTDELFNRIKLDGYLSQKSLSGNPINEIRVNIGRTGEILFNGGGRHRLVIAKLLDLDSVPVLVLVRHEQWEKLRKQYLNTDKSDSVSICEKHPDLQQ